LFFVWPQTTVRRVSLVTETTAPHFDPGRKPLITHTPRVTESADPAQKNKRRKTRETGCRMQLRMQSRAVPRWQTGLLLLWQRS